MKDFALLLLGFVAGAGSALVWSYMRLRELEGKAVEFESRSDRFMRYLGVDPFLAGEAPIPAGICARRGCMNGTEGAQYCAECLDFRRPGADEREAHVDDCPARYVQGEPCLCTYIKGSRYA